MRQVLRRLIACVGLTWLAAVAAVLLGRIVEPVLGPLAVMFGGLVCVEVVRSTISRERGTQ